MERFIIRSQAWQNHYSQFVNYLRTVGYSTSSWKTFALTIKEFLHWIEKQQITSLDQVSESDIERFYDYLQHRPIVNSGGTLSESRIMLHLYTVKLFFQYLQDAEQIEVNPTGNFNYTRDYKRTRENLLIREDIEKLYQVCETAKQRAMLGIIYGCGLRRQEAVKLNAKDIHFKSGMLYIREGKGGRKRTIPLSKTVLNDLKEYYYNQRSAALNYTKEATEAFILNTRGRRMQNYTYSVEVKKLITAAGLNQQISLHHFRHAIATHLLESGMKLEHVKDFLGHKSIETTQTYTHITTTQLKKTTAYGTSNLPG